MLRAQSSAVSVEQNFSNYIIKSSTHVLRIFKFVLTCLPTNFKEDDAKGDVDI